MMALYIKHDGDGEPTLWACDAPKHTSQTCDCDWPQALTRMCDVGNERAWSVLCVGVMAMQGALL